MLSLSLAFLRNLRKMSKQQILIEITFLFFNYFNLRLHQKHPHLQLVILHSNWKQLPHNMFTLCTVCICKEDKKLFHFLYLY